MRINWSSITSAILDSLDLDQLFAVASQQECLSCAEQVTLALKNEEAWTPAQQDALRFVGATLSMMLQHANANDPFGPMFVFGGERSNIPMDYPRQTIADLLDWALTLNIPEVRARMLDVIWVCARSFPAAQAAVPAYIESAEFLEDPDLWTDSAERLERALRLAASLGKGGTALRDSALAKIESVVEKYQGTDPKFLTYRLVSLLLEFKYGNASVLATFSTTAAEQAKVSGDYWRAKDYYGLAAKCFEASGQDEKRNESRRLSAEALALEAELATSEGAAGRGAMAGASIMAQAYDAMRKVPDGKARADELHARLLKLQQLSLGELKQVSTNVDIAELVQKGIANVLGRPLHQAIIALCQVSKPPAIEKLKEQVRNEARVAVLSSMFSSDVINSRGRVVAKALPIKHGEENVEDEGLRFRLFRHARHGRDLITQAFINPMRTTIFNEHNPDRLDVLSAVEYSPWIPAGHLESIARVLVAGFQGDMLIVAHMAPPQLEAMVRQVIELNGGNTSMFDPQGLQPEKSLNVLLAMKEAKTAFGDLGILELEDLLVDQLGTNLRNEVAHGLLPDGQMFSGDVLYVWWILLKFCVLSSQWQSERMTNTTQN